MNCNVVKDLIPLYLDDCCSAESKALVEEHLKSCSDCKKLSEDMKSAQTDISYIPEPPAVLRKISDWKASVLQSVLLFFSFALITLGVTFEAQTPLGQNNGFWALSMIIPSTGFMLSLANWYFVRLYKSRKGFSNCSALFTLGITICAYVWAFLHYGFGISALMLPVGLTVVFCALSKALSGQYAKMLGKE